MKKMPKIISAIVLSVFMFTACDNNKGPYIKKMENGHQVIYSGEKPAKGMISHSINNSNNTWTRVLELYVNKGIPAGDFKLYDIYGHLLIDAKGKWKKGMFDGEIFFHDIEDDVFTECCGVVKKEINMKGTFKISPDKILDYEGNYDDAREIVESFYNGTAKSDFLKITMKDGLPDGDYEYYKEYTDEGKIKFFLISKGKYKAGEYDGKCVSYMGPGKLHFEKEYKNGLLDGDVRYYNYDGKIVSEYEYKDDNLDGTSKDYYENGQLNTSCTYKNDELDGLYEKYYENGQLNISCTYKNDELDGSYKEYYENGQLNISTSYINGKQNGLRETFTKNGNRISEENYVNGNIDGKFCEYDENGNKKVEGTKKNGRYNGVITFYKNGIKYKEGPYKNGVEHGLIYEYNEKGIPILASEYENGSQDRNSANIYFDAAGNKSKAYMNGKFIIYYPSGNIKKEVENDEDRQGRRHLIEYYENGNKKYEADYFSKKLYNELHYDEDGILILE